MLNVLTLQTKSRKIRHTTNIRIRALFWTIRARDSHNLHADSAARKMSAALGTTEAGVDARRCEGVSEINCSGGGGNGGGSWTTTGVLEIVGGVCVAVQAADCDLAGRRLDYWGSVLDSAFLGRLLFEFDSENELFVALEEVFVGFAPGFAAEVVDVSGVAEGHY